MLLYFITFWNILRPFGIIYGPSAFLVCGRLVYFSVLVQLDQEKSGNPACGLLCSENGKNAKKRLRLQN
jgi:hypothetical protein